MKIVVYSSKVNQKIESLTNPVIDASTHSFSKKVIFQFKKQL